MVLNMIFIKSHIAHEHSRMAYKILTGYYTILYPPKMFQKHLCFLKVYADSIATHNHISKLHERFLHYLEL